MPSSGTRHANSFSKLLIVLADADIATEAELVHALPVAVEPAVVVPESGLAADASVHMQGRLTESVVQPAHNEEPVPLDAQAVQVSNSE